MKVVNEGGRWVFQARTSDEEAAIKEFAARYPQKPKVTIRLEAKGSPRPHPARQEAASA